MPTNLYGHGDNYDLEKSHVLPALLRKFHLGKALEDENWQSIRNDLDRNPIEKTDGKSDKDSILTVLAKYGISGKYTDKPACVKVTVILWGTGSPLREFMNSQDMAEACVFVMETVNVKDIIAIHRSTKSEENYHPPHFLNIGTGEEISIKELAYKIKALTGFSGEIFFDNSKPDGTMRKTTDVAALRGLGYNHQISLDEGLKITYDKYRK
jgi:GDP-L-fucose synthase